MGGGWRVDGGFTEVSLTHQRVEVVDREMCVTERRKEERHFFFLIYNTHKHIYMRADTKGHVK